MTDERGAAALLDTARKLLRDELLPALPADKRHAALMIAKAMAIASRQSMGLAHAQDELEALDELMPSSRTMAVDDSSRLAASNRLLCTLIREGRADDGIMRAKVLGLLWKVTRRKVEQSNPQYLPTMPPTDLR